MSWVAILMGSESDWPTMEAATEPLQRLNIVFEVRVCSAHRTPQAMASYVTEAEERGCRIFICGAGMAAHLAGAVAAHSIRPVIGVPIDAGPLNGFDALLSTVQMPGGIPVATVAVGKSGARNAGYLAAQILAVADEKLGQGLRDERSENAEKVTEQNARLAARLAGDG